jgi:hypothetical protein
MTTPTTTLPAPECLRVLTQEEYDAVPPLSPEAIAAAFAEAYAAFEACEAAWAPPHVPQGRFR